MICVNTGDKFDQWYTDNLKYMIDNYSCLQYDNFEVIEEEVYGGVYDKLQMFDLFRDGQNIYFDIDVLIKGDCNEYLTKDLTVCHAWWRKPFHTPLNSSIISWQGDQSNVYNIFDDDWINMMRKYYRGIDQYLYEVHDPKTYTSGYCSYQTIKDEKDYNVYFFNQTYDVMKTSGWWSTYFLNKCQ